MAVSLIADAFNGGDDAHADDFKVDVKPARPGTASSAADSTTSSLPSAAGPAPRKARSGSTSAAVLGRKANPEKRANHNAIERARRESLNSRFLILAASLPAISEIRRPSKSLIVNRSLQFVADSLSREVLYRDIVKDLHLRNRQLLEQLNEYRANAGHHDQLEQLPPLEPNMPKPLTEVEKDKASSRPKNGISTGTLPPGTAAVNNTLAAAAAAAAAAVAAVTADSANDLDEDDDDGFPLPAGGLEGLSMSFGANAGAGSYGSPISPVDGISNMEALHHAHLLQQQQQQQHYLQAAAGYFAGVAAQPPFATAAPAQTAPLATAAATNSSPASPPELSSGASSGSSPVSSVSSSTGTPALYDMAQPYPVMSAAALAAANAHAAQQHASTSAAGHTRAATAPATSAAVASMAQQMASLYASAHHAHAHHIQPPQTPSGPVPAQHPNLHYIAAYLQEQAQHQHTLAAAAAAAQAQQHQQHHQQQQQNNQTYAALAAQAQARVHALSINTSAAAAAPSYLSGGASAPLPSPFLVAPVNGFAA